MPKIKWLASHKPEVLAEGARLFDLADYLTWRATGDATRSTCTVGCKWNWRPQGWDRSFLDAIGLGDVATRVDIGAAFAAPGAALGEGLDAAAARDLGLPRGAAVGARAGKGCEIPNFKGSYLGRFPLVLADFWTSDHLSERSRP